MKLVEPFRSSTDYIRLQAIIGENAAQPQGPNTCARVIALPNGVGGSGHSSTLFSIFCYCFLSPSVFDGYMTGAPRVTVMIDNDLHRHYRELVDAMRRFSINDEPELVDQEIVRLLVATVESKGRSYAGGYLIGEYAPILLDLRLQRMVNAQSRKSDDGILNLYSNQWNYLYITDTGLRRAKKRLKDSAADSVPAKRRQSTYDWGWYDREAHHLLRSGKGKNLRAELLIAGKEQFGFVPDRDNQQLKDLVKAARERHK